MSPGNILYGNKLLSHSFKYRYWCFKNNYFNNIKDPNLSCKSIHSLV